MVTCVTLGLRLGLCLAMSVIPAVWLLIQVRLVHTSGGVGDWSEGISLGELDHQH